MFKKNMRFRFITSLPLCLFVDTPKMITGGIIHGRCQVYTGSGIAITTDGSILPCTHFTKEIGDIDEFSRGYERFRKKITRYPSRKCEDCILWGACAGGCPILWTKLNAEKEIPGLKGKVYEGRPASPGIAMGYLGKDIKSFEVATVEKELELIGVKGVITEQRSVITHFAIIARELGIPCVAGVKVEEKEGVCIVNGYTGKVFVLK
jgi:radical SAM protein with 4Fe4S-binding SPASM domain